MRLLLPFLFRMLSYLYIDFGSLRKEDSLKIIQDLFSTNNQASNEKKGVKTNIVTNFVELQRERLISVAGHPKNLYPSILDQEPQEGKRPQKELSGFSDSDQ